METRIAEYGSSFSGDCGLCGEADDMRWFDHDLDKFVCRNCADDLRFAQAALSGEVGTFEPKQPKVSQPDEVTYYEDLEKWRNGFEQFRRWLNR